MFYSYGIPYITSSNGVTKANVTLLAKDGQFLFNSTYAVLLTNLSTTDTFHQREGTGTSGTTACFKLS